jgi:hypothetical protein
VENDKEIYKFMETHDVPKLKQDNINILNRSMTRNETETVTNNHPRKKCPGPDRFTAEFPLNQGCEKDFHMPYSNPV